MGRLGMALLIVGVMLFASTRNSGPGSMMLVIAAMIGGYMAINIGANDVANNVGPAVGSKAMSLGLALVIAAVFEAAGALIAGGDVVDTIRSGIINPALVPSGDTFIWLMMSALLAARHVAQYRHRDRRPGIDHAFDRRRGARRRHRRKAGSASPTGTRSTPSRQAG